MKHRTAVIHCFVADPVTGESYTRDPRYVARKAEEHLRSTGIADTAYFGPESEFFVFDDVRFDTQPNGAFYLVDSVEGQWNTGTDEMPNLAYKPRTKQGYFPAPPMDHYQDLRSDMSLALHGVGIETDDRIPVDLGECGAAACAVDLEGPPVVPFEVDDEPSIGADRIHGRCQTGAGPRSAR